MLAAKSLFALLIDNYSAAAKTFIEACYYKVHVLPFRVRHCEMSTTPAEVNNLPQQAHLTLQLSQTIITALLGLFTMAYGAPSTFQ